MLIHKSQKAFLLTLLTLVACFCKASSPKWNEIHTLKGKLNFFRTGEYGQLIREIQKKGPKINYTEAFMLGKAYFALKKYRESAAWFARSVYHSKSKPRKNHASYLRSYLTSWGNLFKEHSPLAAEALYHVALCYHQLGAGSQAIQFLDMMEKHLNEELREKYWELKARILTKISDVRGLGLYEKLIQKYKKSTYYIRKASIYGKTKKSRKAVDTYFQALEFNRVSWSYKVAVKQIFALGQKQPSLLKRLSDRKKIFLAEGHRIWRRHKKAKGIWRQVKIASLSRHDLSVYVRFYSAFLVDQRRYSEAVQTVKRNSSSFNQKEKDKLIHALAARLLKKNKYQELIRLIPPYSPNTKLTLIRMQALRKTESSFREKEAAHYLKNHDADSSITERTYFSSCLQKIIKKETSRAVSCLKRLAKHTKNMSAGGRSRYFLARFAEENNKSKKDVLRKYAEVYLNSPSDFYVFKALEKSLKKTPLPLPKNNIKKIRLWLSMQAGDPKNIRRFFAQKKKDPDYSVDPFWKEWERKLQSLDQADPKIKKAILFIGMGFNALAEPYLKKLDPIQRLLIYQKAGHLVDDAYIKHAYLKAYAIKKKKSVDIFTLSNKARDSLYPTPYKKYIREASNRFGVNQERLYALMKQESGFHPGLRSSAGATGAMQLMPSTARWLNKKLKIKKMSLTNPRHSILLGTKFYADASKKYSDQFEEIAIAYNAGPRRLVEWKKSIPTDDQDLFLERIPFRETNLYVKRTRSYYDRYKALAYFVSK